jgi:hypothetical protein
MPGDLKSTFHQGRTHDAYFLKDGYLSMNQKAKLRWRNDLLTPALSSEERGKRFPRLWKCK